MESRVVGLLGGRDDCCYLAYSPRFVKSRLGRVFWCSDSEAMGRYDSNIDLFEMFAPQLSSPSTLLECCAVVSQISLCNVTLQVKALIRSVYTSSA